MANYLLGCDWGTSSFRLCLFDLHNEKVLDEVRSADGVAVLFRSWQEENQALHRRDIFLAHLKKSMDTLSQRTGIAFADTPVIISGMASSSIGIEAVPYADLPFSLNGKDARVEKLVAKKYFENDILLISGVRSDDDVMRGEETQLIGLSSLRKELMHDHTGATYIFPGTHSKHMHILKDTLVDFKTFMTGELFALLSRHSILKDSVLVNDERNTDEKDGAFKQGVLAAMGSNILNRIFSVRTNQLFGHLDKISNAHYLSGLLVGYELKELKNSNGQLFFCCGKNLFSQYYLAAEVLGLLERSTFVEPELTEHAAVLGQKIIFEKLL